MRDVADARPLVAHLDVKHLGQAFAFESEFDFAAAGVAIGVARDLGDGSSDASLVLPIEAQQARNLATALAGNHHVLLVLKRHCQQSLAHDLPVAAPRLRSTTTLVS